MGDQTSNNLNGNPDGGDAVEEVADSEETYEQEYVHLDTTLNELDTYLDALESKNDDLFSRLQDLLEDSRQARKELEAPKEAKEDQVHSDVAGSQNSSEKTKDNEQKSENLKTVEQVDQCLSNLHVDAKESSDEKKSDTNTDH